MSREDQSHDDSHVGKFVRRHGVAVRSPLTRRLSTKPITIIVPFSAGGPTDTVARLLGQAMGTDLKQTMIVENVAGAGGTVGAGRAARSDPDGYTLFLHHIGMSTAPALYRKLPYNPIEDFALIGLVTDVPMTIGARQFPREGP